MAFIGGDPRRAAYFEDTGAPTIQDLDKKGEVPTDAPFKSTTTWSEAFKHVTDIIRMHGEGAVGLLNPDKEVASSNLAYKKSSWIQFFSSLFSSTSRAENKAIKRAFVDSTFDNIVNNAEPPFDNIAKDMLTKKLNAVINPDSGRPLTGRVINVVDTISVNEIRSQAERANRLLDGAINI
ncbi:MAG: hypothetical protein ACOYJQ_11355 [Pseudochelatococcus sp.]|jgi:hypothetical protein|uniref:hypothetical protein n=1 Tax=Pseudochelatococcus sp. TaxID=2020869 RepID=UPI003D93B61F